MTKRESFVAILDYVKDNADLTDFVNAQIASLDKKAATAAANRKKNNAASDDMADLIAETVADEAMTITDIVAAIAETYPDATNAKVSFRANALCDDGVLTKTEIKDGKRTLVAYTHA